MVVKKIHEAGVTSDVAYTAAFGSILLSIGIWLTYKSDEPGHAERWVFLLVSGLRPWRLAVWR